MIRPFQYLSAAALAFALSAPAAAHHSFAMFDSTKQVTLTGTVKEFQWTNPHSWLQLTVPKGASSTEWSIELLSPNTMSRKGWRKSSFRPGDKVTVTIAPMRDGSPGGSLLSAVDRDGRTLTLR